MNLLLIFLGTSIIFLSRLLNLGNGSTWPGHIALNINKNFIKEIIKANFHLKTILIAGTNGKTTTGKLIKTILEKANYKVFQNESGANLLNGIASSLILNSNLSGKIDKDFAIFEIDENTLPLILKEINNPDYVLILNLFRDQLDRYGEVNTIAKKWKAALNKLSPKTKLILNADDPQIVNLGFYHISKAIPIPYRKRSYASVFYFGLGDKKFATSHLQHAVDSTYCPSCDEKLTYSSVYFSHLGDWKCTNCGYKHPEKIFTDSPFYPLVGLYNKYNANAAALLAKKVGVDNNIINSALHEFKPAFGRQEILNINEKKVQIFLSKNPTSFNESLKTISTLKANNLLIVLNDRIPDGRDVSWIWDVDFEEIADLRRMKINVSGDRVYDLALRLRYSELSLSETQIHADIKTAINTAIKNTPRNEILYILPTYSAMLEVRKILTGRKIL